MKVLFLGPPNKIYKYLKKEEDCVLQRSNSMNGWDSYKWDEEFIISHGYQYIVPEHVLNQFPHGCAINIHSGLLPFVRGVHPMFWSVLIGIPLGYTTHIMTKKLDSGPIVDRGFFGVFDEKKETFRTLWEQVEEFVFKQFTEKWDQLKRGKNSAINVIDHSDFLGNYFSRADFDYIRPHVLKEGWDTTITEAKERYDVFKLHHPDWP